ncbi:nnp-1 protein putative nuclear protein 1 nop52 [Anaeramoeba flamelloides]|uniref:Nnp-1 protein putative nuclear protein 1 nop52 n=1 Tax=Anaeramoeba flamelloides TaxID=1746091 RepID=A0ABQ8Z5C9_9EUKA|nr:nnp-1 protein putative nuclear protein 1 nop52 [Anaeramoeba flamelloides]
MSDQKMIKIKLENQLVQMSLSEISQITIAAFISHLRNLHNVPIVALQIEESKTLLKATSIVSKVISPGVTVNCLSPQDFLNLDHENFTDSQNNSIRDWDEKLAEENELNDLFEELMSDVDEFLEEGKENNETFYQQKEVGLTIPQQVKVEKAEIHNFQQTTVLQSNQNQTLTNEWQLTTNLQQTHVNNTNNDQLTLDQSQQNMKNVTQVNQNQQQVHLKNNIVQSNPNQTNIIHPNQTQGQVNMNNGFQLNQNQTRSNELQLNSNQQQINVNNIHDNQTTLDQSFQTINNITQQQTNNTDILLNNTVQLNPNQTNITHLNQTQGQVNINNGLQSNQNQNQSNDMQLNSNLQQINVVNINNDQTTLNQPQQNINNVIQLNQNQQQVNLNNNTVRLNPNQTNIIHPNQIQGQVNIKTGFQLNQNQQKFNDIIQSNQIQQQINVVNTNNDQTTLNQPQQNIYNVTQVNQSQQAMNYNNSIQLNQNKNETNNNGNITGVNHLQLQQPQTLTHSRTFEEEIEMELLKNELIDFSDDEMDINANNGINTLNKKQLLDLFNGQFNDIYVQPEEEKDNVYDENTNKIINDGISQFSTNSNSVVYTATPPHELICPLTGELFVDPMKTPNGFYFEKSAILQYIQQNGKCPISNLNLSFQDLSRADDVRIYANQWRLQNSTLVNNLNNIDVNNIIYNTNNNSTEINTMTNINTNINTNTNININTNTNTNININTNTNTNKNISTDNFYIPQKNENKNQNQNQNFNNTKIQSISEDLNNKQENKNKTFNEFSISVMNNKNKFNKDWKLVLYKTKIELINSQQDKVETELLKFNFRRNNKNKAIAKLTFQGNNLIIKFANEKKCNKFSQLRTNYLIETSGGTLKPKKKMNSIKSKQPIKKSKDQNKKDMKKEKDKENEKEKGKEKTFDIDLVTKKSKLICQTQLVLSKNTLEFLTESNEKICCNILDIKYFHLQKNPFLEIDKKKYFVKFHEKSTNELFKHQIQQTKREIKLKNLSPSNDDENLNEREKENNNNNNNNNNIGNIDYSDEDNSQTNEKQLELNKNLFQIELLNKLGKSIGKGKISIQDKTLSFQEINPNKRIVSDKIVYVTFSRSKKLKRVGRLSFNSQKISFFVKFEKTKYLTQFEKKYSFGFQQTLKTHKFKIKVIKHKDDEVVDKGNITIRGNEIKIILKETTIVGKIDQVRHFKHKSNQLISRIIITEYSLTILFSKSEHREKFSKVLTLSNSFVIPEIVKAKEFEVTLIKKDTTVIAKSLIVIFDKIVSIRINGEETLKGNQDQVFLSIANNNVDDDDLDKKKKSKKSKKSKKRNEINNNNNNHNHNNNNSDIIITLLFQETKGKAYFKLKNQEQLNSIANEIKLVTPKQDPNFFKALIIKSPLKKLKKDNILEISFSDDNVKFEMENSKRNKQKIHTNVDYNKYFESLINEDNSRVIKFSIGKKKHFILEFTSKSIAKSFFKRVLKITSAYNKPKKKKK